MRKVATIIALFFSLTIFGGVAFAATEEDVAARRAQLERDLAALEAEIENQTVFLEEKQRERVSLERDVAILDAEIQKARLSIKARDLSIRKLTNDIGAKSDTITALDEKLNREKQSLANILRKTNEIDDHTIVEFVLAAKDVSEFFADIDSFAAIKSSLRDSFYDIEDTKVATAEQRSTLEARRAEEQELRTLQVLEQRKIEDKKAERADILRVTKGEEDAYQDLINSIEKTAAQIRAELFTLRDSAAIPFGEALELANFASSKTGVRPALILGVLTQETRLGEYLGTGSYKVDAHPTRDVPLFLAITRTLGYDPDRMPVSKKAGLSAYGGAMGPAQFIPSTWACYGGFVNVNTGDCANSKKSLGWTAFWAGPWEYRASEDRIRKLLGSNTPSDPWQNRDAFMASATLLRDNGAARGTFDAERRAAVRYFAGWGNGDNSTYIRGYGDPVMDHTAFFQRQIDILGGS